jgi:predicted GH43/DUF377 family glycosyl hydrolase
MKERVQTGKHTHTYREIGRGTCAYRGAATGETRECKACGNKTQQVPLFSCAAHGRCTERVLLPQVPCCRICPDYDPTTRVRIQEGPTQHRYVGAKITRWDLPEHSYNPTFGELRYWRRGRGGSKILVNGTEVRLVHHNCDAGREDPRFFWHDGRPHLAFSGVQVYGNRTSVHQMVARLSADGRTAERVWCPDYPARTHWEKNWGFFSQDGALFSVYSIAPHVVLLHTGGIATEFAREQWSPQWAGGALRGGASPVRVGDEWFSFFHGALDHGGTPYRTYTMGCYTFSAQPPFQPLRYTPYPLLSPPADGWPVELGVSVVFPGGAALAGDVWTIAYGLHDRWCETIELRHADVERAMRNV